MSTAFISSLRYWFLLLSVVLAFLGLMGRLVYLQAIKHDEYSQIAFVTVNLPLLLLRGEET